MRIIVAFVLAFTLAGCYTVPVSTPADDYIGQALNPVSQPDLPSPSDQPGATTAPASQADRLLRVDPPAAGPLKLTVRSAVLLAVQNNKALAVERINPRISRTFEQQEAAAFDPTIFADVSMGSSTSDLPRGVETHSHTLAADAGARVRTPAGTDLSAMLELSRTSPGPNSHEPLGQTRAEVSVTQALLAGAGAKVNLASLRQAEIDTLRSLYELRGFTLALVADVQTAYWNYVLAARQIAIFEESVAVAKRQLGNLREAVDVGKLARSELPAAEAELALRVEGLIDARSSLVQARLRLARLLNPGGSDAWTREIVPLDLPAVPEVRLDSADAHVALALMKRPDMNQARLLIKRDELEIVKTKNGLLPRMDLFATLGKSGYAESLGRSAAQIAGESYDFLTGVRFEHAPRNRAADARNTRALATRDQARESLENLGQLVQVDVRGAYEELTRTREKVTATAATRKLQETSVRTEREKFNNGKSTALQVTQVERDLLAAQVNEVQAAVAHLNAYVELYQLDGSLLDRLGLVTPGPESPVAN